MGTSEKNRRYPALGCLLDIPRSRSPDHQIMSPTWCCHQLLIDRNGILLSQEGNGLTCDGRCKRGLILRTGGQAFPEINEVWDDDDDDEYYYYQ